MTSATKYSSKLVNQRVLIFGGTSGIGFCVAEAAIENGSNTAKLEKAVARLREANNGASKINHVVFTAGDALDFPELVDLTPDLIQKSGVVRFVAPLMVAKYIRQYMDLTTTSSFTLTGGLRAHKPAPGWSLVSGWAAGVEGLVRGLALDLKPLRVNMVSPGAVQTELFSRFPSEQLEGFLKMLKNQSTTGTVGRPEDVAEAYLYLMKDQFVSGSIVETNGGALLV
ncbi:uncharacterized oxidoreductase YkvO [Aspergillus udagawae]|uniref:Uncharacterized oxidoreductase YkvO n=1 Tax=Aspergillus udagawae TaxID=91492 RepID=A0A8H3S907_9EURO|nr:uncharacterized oxidoreductase YkvO [Aspergillus udagawae]